MSILRNNSAKSRNINEIFPKLYVSRSERCVVCYKILEVKGNILFERKIYTHDCHHGKKLILQNKFITTKICYFDNVLILFK
jgi:hypothetical protein